MLFPILHAHKSFTIQIFFRASCGTIPASHKNLSRLRGRSVSAPQEKKQLQPCKHRDFLPCCEQTAPLTRIYPLSSQNPGGLTRSQPGVNVSPLSVGLECSRRNSQPDPSLSCRGISVLLGRQSRFFHTPGLDPQGLHSSGIRRALQPLECHRGCFGVTGGEK